MEYVRYSKLLKAIDDLLCTPVFTGELFSTDKESHKLWTNLRFELDALKGPMYVIRKPIVGDLIRWPWASVCSIDYRSYGTCKVVEIVQDAWMRLDEIGLMPRIADIRLEDGNPMAIRILNR